MYSILVSCMDVSEINRIYLICNITFTSLDIEGCGCHSNDCQTWSSSLAFGGIGVCQDAGQTVGVSDTQY